MPDTNAPAARPQQSAAVLVGLLLVALALRPQLAGIGPLAGDIVADLGVSHSFVGLLTTIPVLCMGLFAPLGPVLARRLGMRQALAAASGAVALVGVARVLLPSEAVLLVLTIAVGFATAISGPASAMFIRERLPNLAVAGSAAYAGGTLVGAAIASGVAVPLATGLGGWRLSLAVISLASGLGAIAWMWLSRPGHASVERPAPVAAVPAPPSPRGLGLPAMPFRSPVVWVIGLMFGLQSWLYYGSGAWLPSAYVERGWEPAVAATLLTVMNVAAIVGSLAAPALSRQGLPRRTLLAVDAVACLVGLVGVAAFPGPGFLWAVCLGAGLGMMLTLALTLPTDVGADASDAGGVSAMMLMVGYVMASVAPFALGAARDATGSFADGMWMLVVIAVVMVPLSWSLTPHRLRPHGLGPAAPVVAA